LVIANRYFEQIELDKYLWMDLIQNQQVAASDLGYTQQTWDDKKALADDNEGESDEVFYKGHSWKSLPIQVQEAALILGYSKRIWDGIITNQSMPTTWIGLN